MQEWKPDPHLHKEWWNSGSTSVQSESLTEKMKETLMGASKSSSAVKHLWFIIYPFVF